VTEREKDRHMIQVRLWILELLICLRLFIYCNHFAANYFHNFIIMVLSRAATPDLPAPKHHIQKVIHVWLSIRCTFPV